MFQRVPYICPLCLSSLRPAPRAIRLRASHNLTRHLQTTTLKCTSKPQTAGSPPAQAQSNAPKDFKPAFATYELNSPPTKPQVSHAHAFFTSPPAATFLLSTPNFRSLPPSNIPEVCFLGRSNVGKSSLLNALLHRTKNTLAFVSSKPGRTRALTAFGVAGKDGKIDRVDKGEVGKTKYASADQEGGGRKFEKWSGRNALVVIDMPGYGKGSREEWGREIMKYVGGRAQLRRTFVLIDATAGPKSTDLDLLAMLRADGVPHQVILTKIDKVLFARKANASAAANNYHKLEQVAEGLRSAIAPPKERGGKGIPDVLMCSTEVAWPLGSHIKMGIDGLRCAVLQAAGLDCDEQGRRRVLDYSIAQDTPAQNIESSHVTADSALQGGETTDDVWAGAEPQNKERSGGRRRRFLSVRS